MNIKGLFIILLIVVFIMMILAFSNSEMVFSSSIILCTVSVILSALLIYYPKRIITKITLLFLCSFFVLIIIKIMYNEKSNTLFTIPTTGLGALSPVIGFLTAIVQTGILLYLLFGRGQAIISPISHLRTTILTAPTYIKVAIATTAIATGAATGIGIAYITTQLTMPTNPTDIKVPNLQITLTYEHNMRVNHPYSVTISLTSGTGNTSLSELDGSILAEQSHPLYNILGSSNAHCISVQLVTDQSSFTLSSTPLIEQPLEQHTATWIWSVTPLHADEQPQQTIPVDIIFMGKSHCGSANSLKGPYQLAQRYSLQIQVTDPDNTTLTRITNNPTFLAILATFLALISSFIGWISRQLWERRTAKKAREEAEDIKKKAHEEAEDIKKKAREEDKNIKQAAFKKEEEEMKQRMFNDMEAIRRKILEQK